ncbi:lysine--tRNA ligase [bacterium]|nr:lysine--tRNA ligase [bacterium]
MERNEQSEIRLEKLQKLREKGIDPFPARPPKVKKVEYQTGSLVQNFERLSVSEQKVTTAGRIIAIRKHGKSAFLHIVDSTGKLQVYLRQDQVGEEDYELLEYMDIGDFIALEGIMFRTRTGEITMDVKAFDFLAKALHPLPEKWHGLKDIELRIRKRYLDLIVNPEVKKIFEIRTNLIGYLRGFLNDRGFQEVDTPILQPLYGGAFATPFTTHHQAMDMELYLRIADELYLKRLIIGGLDRVYEIGKNFRNEGIDRFHNPEFTLVELYQAYADYNDMAELAEELLIHLGTRLFGSQEIEYEGEVIRFSKPFQRFTLHQAIQQYTRLDIRNTKIEGLKEYCINNEIILPEVESYWKIVEKIFDEKVQPYLIQPTFIWDYPLEISPLAKKKEGEDDLVERFELFIAGMEVANAFSELNDPLDQKSRFEKQLRLREMGDADTHQMDHDFILAMEHGMPPTGGMGLGLDRLVMLFANAPSIREVILFPLTRLKE